jgi:hypothetical protein
MFDHPDTNLRLGELRRADLREFKATTGRSAPARRRSLPRLDLHARPVVLRVVLRDAAAALIAFAAGAVIF